MEFLKPTKVTWIAFAVILIINVIFFILGIFDIFDEWPLYQIPFFQIGWLYAFFRWILDIRVIGQSNEFIATPNLLGWILIISGSLISFFLYYFTASLVSQYYYKKREVDQYNKI